MNELKFKILKKIRNPKILIIAGLLGIFLIFISSFFTSDKDSKPEKTSTPVSAEEYRLNLEEDISRLVREITGSRAVSVVVTLENTVSYSYADTREEISSDKKGEASVSTDTELKENYITVKTADGGEQALIVTANMPEIRGVAIVCEGGDNEFINEKILNTVTAALNITKKRVYICGRNAK